MKYIGSVECDSGGMSVAHWGWSIIWTEAWLPDATSLFVTTSGHDKLQHACVNSLMLPKSTTWDIDLVKD